jgi:hypothetical protein
MGGVAAYLLIGVTWAFGYRLLLEMIPGAIHFQTPLGAGVATGEPSRLIYFSFETLTTVSYGDAYPVHRIARSLTTAEALIEQFRFGCHGLARYLATTPFIHTGVVASGPCNS